MCSRYTLLCREGFGERFRAGPVMEPIRPTFNVAPGRVMPVIVGRDAREVRLMRWGLIPHWAGDDRTIRHPFNARSETLAEKPMFRGLLKNNRCLVPASGFFEWKKDGGRKVPFYVRLKDESCFSFAGLYDTWQDREGRAHPSYTIITTGANELVAAIHERMPVILLRQDEGRWLSGNLLPAPALREILRPFPAGGMEAYPVEVRVNDPAIDEESLVKPRSGLSF